jgi:predicted nucleic acid-binding protein
MFLLDTNVVSELRKTRTQKIDANVERWWATVRVTEFSISVVTLLELEEGVLRLQRRDTPQGKILRDWVDRFVIKSFEGRILPITSPVARACAVLQVPDKRPLGDALIAATAIVHGLKIVTRNEVDFAGAGADIINPWLRAP